MLLLGISQAGHKFWQEDLSEDPRQEPASPGAKGEEKHSSKRLQTLPATTGGGKQTDFTNRKLVSPFFLSRLSTTPDESGDHRSRQEPPGENKPQSLIRTEIRHPEWPTLQKQLESQRALSSGVKRPQEVCSVPTSTHPEDSRVAALLPENLPTSPEIRKKLEQHIQERFICHLRDLPGNIQETLQLKRLQGELPGRSQAQCKHGPSRTVTFPGESNTDAQKAGLRLRQDLGTGLRGFMGCVPEDLSSGSEISLMTLQGVSSEESESDLRLPSHDLLEELDKSVENILKRHLRRTLGKTDEGLTSLVSPVFFSHLNRIPDASGDHRSCQETPGENKPQSLIRTEIRHPEWPTLQKQLESQRALSSGVKRPQEVCSVPTSNLPEDSRVAALLPENLPTSPEIWKKLEQHIQERFICHLRDLPGNIQETLQLKRLQGELPGTSQAQCKHGPSQTVTFPGESNTDAQKAGLRLRQDLGTGLRGFMGCVPEDLSSGLETSLMTLQGLVSPVFFSHLSRIPNESGDHRSRQEPPGENKPQSLIRTEIRHPEWPTLQKQLESQRALSSGVKRPQEVCSVPTSNLPEDSRVAALLPENLPTSPEIRKKLEQHIQERFIHHQRELPGNIQETLQLKRLQGELPGRSQAQCKHGPSRTVTFPGESNTDAQKAGLRLRQDLGTGLRGFMWCVPEDLSSGSEISLMTLQGVSSEESESDLRLPSHDLLEELDKSVENILKRHLRRKLGKTGVGLASDTLPKSELSSATPGSRDHSQADQFWRMRILRLRNSKPQSVGVATPMGNSKPQSVGVTIPMGSSKPQSVGVSTPMGSCKPQSVGVSTPMGSCKPQSVVVATPMDSSKPQSVGVSTPMGSCKPQSVVVATPMGSSKPQSVGVSTPMGSCKPQSVVVATPMGSSNPQSVGVSTPMGSCKPQSVVVATPMGSSKPQSVGVSTPMGSCKPQSVVVATPMGSSKPQSVGVSTPMGSCKPQSVVVATPMGSCKPQSVVVATPMGSSKPQSVGVSTPMGSSKPQSVGVSTPMGHSKPQYMGVPTPTGSLPTQSQGK
ncbi:Spermatogenesis-Associated Protein 31A6 [Manis pentadactyla]|nr:Spermatogenesis-Associated Protein 31A6 [Manis pentadactyla]